MLALPALAPLADARAQQASPPQGTGAVARILAGRMPERARVALDIPPISENGNAVEVRIAVDHPMTGEDRIARIHIVAEKNPYPHVATFHFGPAAGVAHVETTIRLATSQPVFALAETASGKVFQSEREVLVAISACIDGG